MKGFFLRVPRVLCGAYVLLRFTRAHLVQPDTRRLDRRQRIVLQLDGRWPFRGARKRASGNRSVVRAFRLLQLLERRGVRALPREPSREPLDRLVLGGCGTFDAEWIAGILAHGFGDPSPIAIGAEDLHCSPKRDGLRRAISGSTRPSSIASATSCAVRGASSTPFR